MPTAVFNFSDADIRMRYREPFLTEGLDLKMAVNTPPGVYRGLRLGTNLADLTVTVVADPTFGDHSAVYETATGHSLTIRRLADFSVDLSAFASKTVVLAIFATYVLGADTAAEVRAYELSPSDTFSGAVERPELVVLGTVVVPASGTIPADNITHTLRSMAWASEAREAVAWSPIVKNPSFEHGLTGDASRFSISDWDKGTIATNGNFQLGTSTVRSGAKSLEFNKTNVAASVAVIAQYQEIPVTPGQLVRVTGWIRQLIAPTAGDINISVGWGDMDSVATTQVDVPAVVLGSTDASFRQVDLIAEVPAGSYILKGLGVGVINLTTGSTGVAFVIDDLQVYVENGSNLARPAALGLSLTQATLGALLVEDPLNYTIGQLAALLRFDQTTPSGEGELIIEAKDQNYGGGTLPPALAHLGRFVDLGKQLLSTAANARKARISTPFHNTFDATLIWESRPIAGSIPSVRMYVSLSGLLLITVNASYDGTNWNKDVAGSQATLFELLRGHVDIFFRDADAAWTTWSPVTKSWGSRVGAVEPLLELFDAGGNRRVAFDHNGLPAGRYHQIHQNWMSPMYAAFIDGIVGTATNTSVLDTGLIPGPALRQFVAVNTDRATKYSQYRPLQGPLQANMVHQLEWEVDATDLVGTPALVYQFGFIHDESVEPSSEDFIKVYKSSASANWQFMTQGTTGPTTVNTGVAAAAAAQRFRIEAYGSGTPGGQRAYCYINGVLVATSTTNFPANDQMAIVSFFKSTGATNKQVIVSPVWYRATRYLTDDQL